MSSPSVAAPWSLRRRLAAGLVLTVGGVLAAMFLVLDYWIDREIYQRLDQTLLERARTVSNTLQQRDLEALERLMPEYDPDGHTEFFTVFDRGGRALLHSSSSGGIALPIGQVQDGTPRYYDVVLPDGHVGRALATRLPAAGGGHAATRLLVVATEREGWDRTERRIHFTLLGGVALAVALVVGLGLAMLQRAFALLRQAGGTVAELDAQAPPQPIGDGFPKELKPFAAAFDAGLRRFYEAADRERRLARDVAHELRTPLAEIRTSAETALAVADPALERASLGTAIAACARMQRSVDTLLQLSRLESGLETPSLDPLDLAALVADMVAELVPVAAERGIAIDAGLPAAAWVQSDYGIVERIVSNLLRNAVEYAPEGGVVACRLQRGDGEWWLSVDNAAPELTTADLQQFGLRFWRKQPEGGTPQHAGLGLALAFALAQALSLPLRFSLDAGRLTARLGPWPAL